MGATTQYYLLGRSVDKNTQEKFTRKKYPFMGRLMGLDGIHMWATDEDIAKQFPAQAVEAKAIIADIEREIDATQNDGKKSFHSFMEALQNIYKSEIANYNAAKKAYEIAKAEYEATTDDYNAPEHIKLIARGDFERAKMTLEEAKKNIRGSYDEKVNALRNQMAEFAANVYRADPSKVDHNTLQLLNAGIMSPDEVEHLADNYRDNPTMLRLIGKYAADRFASTLNDRDRTTAVKWASLKDLQNLSDSSAAIAGFDQMADYGRKGFASDMAAMANEKHWDRMYHSACEAYDNFIIQPDGGAAAAAHKETVAKLNAAVVEGA